MTPRPLEEFRQYVEGEAVREAFRAILAERGFEDEDYFHLLERYLEDPAGFILCGRREDGKRRNDVVTIYQMLANSWPPPGEDETAVHFYSCGTSLSQCEAAGHFDIQAGGHAVRVDPGGGAMGQCRDVLRRSGGRVGIDPLWLSGIAMTHSHNDHRGGFEAIFERMRWNGLRKVDKFVVGNSTALFGAAEFDVGGALDKYKQAHVEARALKPGETFRRGEMKITATPAWHVEAVDGRRRLEDSCIGLRFELPRPGGRPIVVGVTGDTEYRSQLSAAFANADMLIAYIVQETERAGSATQKEYGLGVSDGLHGQFLGESGAVHLARNARAKLLVLTDFGDQHKSPSGRYDGIPQAMAARVQEQLGEETRVLAAKPGMKIRFSQDEFEVIQTPPDEAGEAS